jgi:hypothetical protein
VMSSGPPARWPAWAAGCIGFPHEKASRTPSKSRPRAPRCRAVQARGLAACRGYLPHWPQWDQPELVAQLIKQATSRTLNSRRTSHRGDVQRSDPQAAGGARRDSRHPGFRPRRSGGREDVQVRDHAPPLPPRSAIRDSIAQPCPGDPRERIARGWPGLLDVPSRSACPATVLRHGAGVEGPGGDDRRRRPGP